MDGACKVTFNELNRERSRVSFLFDVLLCSCSIPCLVPCVFGAVVSFVVWFGVRLDVALIFVFVFIVEFAMGSCFSICVRGHRLGSCYLFVDDSFDLFDLFCLWVRSLLLFIFLGSLIAHCATRAY